MSTHAVLHHPGPPHKYVSPQVSAANTRIKAALGTSLSLTDALLVPRGGLSRQTFHFSFLLLFPGHQSIMITASEDEYRRTNGTVITIRSVATIPRNFTWMFFFFIYLFNCCCFFLCVMVCCFKLTVCVGWSRDPNGLCLTRCVKVLGHKGCEVEFFVLVSFLAVLTPKVAVILLYITEVPFTLKFHKHNVVPQQFQCLFFTRFGCLSSSVAHSIICPCTNYQMELLCLHKSNVLFISFTILLEKNQKTEKMFWKNAKVKEKKEKERNELNCIFFFVVSIVYLFSEKSVFCGFHEPLFPEEQHPVPWRKGWREEKTPSYQNEADVRRQWERDGILKSKEEASWWGNKYCRGG